MAEPDVRLIRDPHRSSVLTVQFQVDTDVVLRGWKEGRDPDVRAEVVKMLHRLCEDAVDQLLCEARGKVPGHP